LPLGWDRAVSDDVQRQEVVVSATEAARALDALHGQIFTLDATLPGNDAVAAAEIAASGMDGGIFIRSRCCQPSSSLAGPDSGLALLTGARWHAGGSSRPRNEPAGVRGGLAL